MALQTAKMAQLNVPGLEDCLKNVSRYLDSAQTAGSNGMQYDYTPQTFSTKAVTAEGLLCRQYLGWKQTDLRLVEGIRALNKRQIDYNGDEANVYYWYDATQACHHMEGDTGEWNSVMRQKRRRTRPRRAPRRAVGIPRVISLHPMVAGSIPLACRSTCSRSTTGICRCTQAIAF